MTSTTAAGRPAANARDGGETPVAIVGAGPYGLSLAAHVRARGIDVRIFGVPMATWRTQMPAGMHLKSEGFASDLYDPDGAFRLSRFCRDAGIPYADIGLPVALETFSNYGLAFARRFAPGLEEREVTDIAPAGKGFVLRFADGGSLRARRVVVAAGITHYPHLPDILRGFPVDLVSHTSAHRSLEKFAGRSVIVVGAGASATDTAALLHKAGAATALVARVPALPFTIRPTSIGRSGSAFAIRARDWAAAGKRNSSAMCPTRSAGCRRRCGFGSWSRNWDRPRAGSPRTISWAMSRCTSAPKSSARRC